MFFFFFQAVLVLLVPEPASDFALLGECHRKSSSEQSLRLGVRGASTFMRDGTDRRQNYLKKAPPNNGVARVGTALLKAENGPPLTASFGGLHKWDPERRETKHKRDPLIIVAIFWPLINWGATW